MPNNNTNYNFKIFKKGSPNKLRDIYITLHAISSGFAETSRRFKLTPERIRQIYHKYLGNLVRQLHPENHFDDLRKYKEKYPHYYEYDKAVELILSYKKLLNIPTTTIAELRKKYPDGFSNEQE